MMQWLQSLPDGWTIYLWLVFAGGLLVLSIIFMRWGAKNMQFDEDIKYVIFNDDDKDNMQPEEFNKMQAVKAEQYALREKFLKEKAARVAARQEQHAKR